MTEQIFDHVIQHKCNNDYTTRGQNPGDRWCQDALVIGNDGSAQGATVFVRTHCANGSPLKDSEQDPLWPQQGVRPPKQ